MVDGHVTTLKIFVCMCTHAVAMQGKANSGDEDNFSRVCFLIMHGNTKLERNPCEMFIFHAVGMFSFATCYIKFVIHAFYDGS